MRNAVIERITEAARRGRRRYDDRRLRLWLLEGGTVGIWSSSFWQGEPICESGAHLRFDLRAKVFSPLQ
jgi:hypothetical protein